MYDTCVTLYYVHCVMLRYKGAIMFLMWYGNRRMFDMDGMNVLPPSSSKFLACRWRHKAILKSTHLLHGKMYDKFISSSVIVCPWNDLRVS
jgi:hypothetical protein